MVQPDLPTVEQILTASGIMTAFQKAWDESFLNKDDCCEQGGYIFADRTQPLGKPLVVQRADKGNTIKQRSESSEETFGIDLWNPKNTDQTKILVAHFHTHPLSEAVKGNPYPSQADLVNGYYRQTPGIVISREGFMKYGIDERESWKNPNGYPDKPSKPPGGLPEGRKVGKSKPTKAPNQWDP